MGTDLIIISNHNVEYGDFDFDRLGRELAARLNQTRLENQEFYWLSRLYWENSFPPTIRENPATLLQPWQPNLDEYRRAEFYENDEWMQGLLSLNGPFEWEVEFRPGNATIYLLPFRYWSWMHHDSSDANGYFRDAYRKALARLVQSIGGTEVTYLADNAHPLELYPEITDYTAMRQQLMQEIGPPLSGFAEMERWQDNISDRQEDRAYLVDDFKDLDWSQPIELPPYLRELRDQNGFTLPKHWPDAL